MRYTLPSGSKVQFWFEHKLVDKLTVAGKKVTHVTCCYLQEQGFPDPFVGLAYCLEGDQFVKETGRKLALKRLLMPLNFNAEDRKALWAIALPKKVKV